MKNSRILTSEDQVMDCSPDDQLSMRTIELLSRYLRTAGAPPRVVPHQDQPVLIDPTFGVCVQRGQKLEDPDRPQCGEHVQHPHLRAAAMMVKPTAAVATAQVHVKCKL